MSRLSTLLLSGPPPPDAVAVWFEDLPLDAPPKPGFGNCWVQPGSVTAELEAFFGLPEGKHPGIWFHGRRTGLGMWR